MRRKRPRRRLRRVRQQRVAEHAACLAGGDRLAQLHLLAAQRRAQPLTLRLAELRGSLQIASAWHDKCNELLAKPTSPEVLVTLLAEGESIPLKLTEVGELRTRLERMRSWADGAAKVMLGSCELKELQERQREAEVLRIRTPESEALATRTVSHAAKPNAVLGTVSATRPAQHALGDTARSRAAAAPPL